MARDIVFDPPTRGLSIVRPPARLGVNEASRAENVNFTTTHVRRRKGKKAAYSSPNGVNSRVTALKRFYDLATTGTVTKKFFIATDIAGDALWCPSSGDWSDDSGPPGAFPTTYVEQVFPNSPTTLYTNGYAAGPITADQIIREIVQAHSWAYFCPSFDATGSDDTNNIKNQPMRGQGNGSVYLHGLVPPASLAAADTTSVGIPAGSTWRVLPVLSTTAPNAAVRSQLARSRILPDRFGFAYKDFVSNSLTVATFDGSAWSTDIVTGPLVPLGTIRTIDFAFDLAGFMCILWIENGTSDLKFSFKEFPATAGPAFWRTETVSAAINFQQCSMTIDDQNIVHVAATDGATFNYYKRDQQASWSAAEVIVAAGVNFPVIRCRRDTYVPRVVYINAANTDVLYRQRDSGAWSAAETVKTGAAALLGSHMALDSTNIPHVSWSDATNSDVLYSNRTSGAWPAAQTVDSNAVPTDTFIDLNPDDLVGVSYDDYPGGFATGENRLATLEGGTWFTAAIAQPALASSCPSFLLEEDNTIFGLGSRGGVNAIFVDGEYQPYFYRLTAEYDDGILGESMPSAATSVIRRSIVTTGEPDASSAIGPYATHTLDLRDGAVGSGRYDMTSDVTRMYVYRTVAGGTATSTFYRVGSVSCKVADSGLAGAPAADFVDNVSDADLVSNKILDTDKYLPPRWKTAAYWKDRLVIGNLKCRDTNDTNQLDVEQGGIHKNRVRYSSAFTPDVYKANFFQDIIPDGGSGSIQKLIVNPLTDTLYVLMENDVVALVGSPLGDPAMGLAAFPIRNVAGSKGTPSPQSVLQYDGRIFYWTKQGIEMIYGLEGRNITSDTIGILWNMMDTAHLRYADRVHMGRLSSVCGAAYVDSVGERILWAYTSGDQAGATNDRILCLHYGLWKQRGFQGDPPYSIYTGWQINAFAVWDGEGDRGELFGGEGLVASRAWTYRLEFDNEDDIGVGASATTLAIQPWFLWTPLYDGGRPDLRKSWMATRLTGKADTAGATYPLEVILDVNGGGLTPTIDTIAWADGTDRMYLRALPRVAQGPRCGLRLKGTDSLAVGEGPNPFELYGLAFLVDDMHMSSRVRGSG